MQLPRIYIGNNKPHYQVVTTEYKTPIAAICGVLFSDRVRFEALNNKVRRDTRNAEFDSLIMSLIKILSSPEVSGSKFYQMSGGEFHIIPAPVLDTTFTGCHPYEQSKFTYGSHNIGGKLLISYPAKLLPRAMITETLLTLVGSELLGRYRAIAALNHDIIENMLPPQVIEQITLLCPGMAHILKELKYVWPAEQMVTSLHNLLMEEIITQNPSWLNDIIENTVRYIRGLKKDILESPAPSDAAADNRVPLARAWLRHYMSILIYNVPMLSRMNVAIEIDGKPTSINDALTEIGINYTVNTAVIKRFFVERNLIPDKDYTPAELKAKISEACSNPELPDCYETAAFRYLERVISKCEFDAVKSITVRNIDALLFEMALNSPAGYDLSHFGAAICHQVTFLPPGYKGISVAKHPHLDDANRAIHKKLGSPKNPIQIESTKLIEAAWQCVTKSPAHSEAIIPEALAIEEYLKTQPDSALRDYLLPKVQTLLAMQLKHVNSHTADLLSKSTGGLAL